MATSRVVLMTGSSSGVGLAVATRLALDPDQRCVVIATVIALSEKNALETAVGTALNKTIFIKELDITNDAEISRVVHDVIDSYGRIDVLVNIAGVMSDARVPEDVTRTEIDWVLGVNLIGTIRLTQAVLPNMKQRKAGKIITIGSDLGKIGLPYSEMYVASKFGVEGYFESLAASLKAFNIRVCLVEPGAMDTALRNTYLENTREYCDSSSLTDIDRRQLTNLLKGSETSTPLTPDDVAEALIRRCLDVDDPEFRHLVVTDDVRADIVASVSDLTGETAVSVLQQLLE